MSASFFLVGLERGDDGLDRDAAGGDELAAGATSRGRERCGPRVLPDQNPGGAVGLHRRGEVLDVFLGEELSELGLDGRQFVDLVEIVDLEGLDRAVRILVEDEEKSPLRG
jgi:hypothetical protein